MGLQLKYSRKLYWKRTLSEAFCWRRFILLVIPRRICVIDSLSLYSKFESFFSKVAVYFVYIVSQSYYQLINISWITKTFYVTGLSRGWESGGRLRVAVKPFEKNPTRSKGGFLVQNKVLKEVCNLTIFKTLTLKLPQKFIFLGYLERSKSQYRISIMAEAALKALSLLMFSH